MMKAYTDLEQSRKLAEILPLESADMVLPFTYKENNEYIPGYAISRNYIEAYNEMLLLPAMDKDTIYKLMQPCWSLAALLGVLPTIHDRNAEFCKDIRCDKWHVYYHGTATLSIIDTDRYENVIDACVEMIIKLSEQNLL